MTSRELVLSTLEFRNTTGRVPRHLWALPWAERNHPGSIERITKDYPEDITGSPQFLREKVQIVKGDPYAIGEYVDEWGCVFNNIHDGIIGEVKHPLVHPDDEDWEDTSAINIPVEYLSTNKNDVKNFCASTDKFVQSPCLARPFEQLQFIRGTENLYIDLMDPPEKMLEFIKKMHNFYKELVTIWCDTDVDGIFFMDDWGSQNSLLINPTIWDQIFAPLYKDYIDIAKSRGKKTFMHSDGNTTSILPRLIELGLDAFNSQLFCAGVPYYSPFKGKITFWGEIDRQHILPDPDTEKARAAVRSVYETLWANGGCIAQCEFSAGSNPDTVYAVYDEWAKVLPC